jgi:hypothetical protein
VKEPPWYFSYCGAPVRVVRVADGVTVEALDVDTGDFVPDLSLLDPYFRNAPEVDDLTEAQFNRRVARIRRALRGQR